MDAADRELLIEATTSAFRERAGRELPVHQAWHDLDEEGREQAFELTRALRSVEAALDPKGWSSTVHAVLRAIES